MDIQKLSINWLDPCPTCERTKYQVETIKGTKDYLYEGDKVTCWCGQTGLIDTDGMEGAWCEWDVKEITEHDKFNAYYRKKYPEYWALLPSCNHQASTHHEELFNSWLNAKAQAVPEGFVLVEKCDIEMMLQLIDNSLGYKSAPNKDDTMKIVKNMLIRITEAQEQSHDS